MSSFIMLELQLSLKFLDLLNFVYFFMIKILYLIFFFFYEKRSLLLWIFLLIYYPFFIFLFLMKGSHIPIIFFLPF